MKSNYQMLRNFENFKPQNRGLVNEEEIEVIEKHFYIKERTDVELQNLRDFVVMYYTMKMERKNADYFNQMDIMSAITFIIDSEKVNRGLEV